MTDNLPSDIAAYCDNLGKRMIKITWKEMVEKIHIIRDIDDEYIIMLSSAYLRYRNAYRMAIKRKYSQLVTKCRKLKKQIHGIDVNINKISNTIIEKIYDSAAVEKLTKSQDAMFEHRKKLERELADIINPTGEIERMIADM